MKICLFRWISEVFLSEDLGVGMEKGRSVGGGKVGYPEKLPILAIGDGEIITYNLTSACRSTSQYLMRKSDLSIFSREMSSHEIVDCQFDGLFWGNAHKLWDDTGIETLESFIFDHFLCAIERVLV